MTASPLRTAHIASATPRYAPLPRTRITSKLIETARHTHVLLCAPAGFGKTAILRETQALLDAQGVDDIVLIDRADEVDPEELRRLVFSGVQVIMAARRRPRLHTAKMELEERLQVWTQPTLRCDGDDVSGMLCALGAPAAPRAVAHEIAQRAEGWIAGAKYLAHDWIQRQHLTGRFGEGLAAYFEETFLAHLTSTQRRRLVLASVPEELSHALYESITGENDFGDLVDAGILAFPTARPGWFRFHRLFRQHLVEHAARLPLCDRTRAHRTAASWLFNAGAPAEAAVHALECGDADFAAEFVDRGARAFIANGQISEALAWLDQAPTPQLDERPRIRLFHVTALALAGRLDEAERRNEELVAMLGETGASEGATAEIAAHARYHRELICYYRDPDRQDLRRIEQLLRDTSGVHPVVFGETMLLKGGAYFRLGDHAAARQHIAGSLDYLEASSSWYALTIGHLMLAQMDHADGAGRRALERCRELIEDLGRRTNMRIAAMAPVAVMIAILSFEHGDMDAAAHWLAEAGDLLPALRSQEWTLEHRLMHARMDMAHGRLQEAMQHAEEARDLAAQMALPIYVTKAASAVAIVHAMQGRHDLASAAAMKPRSVPRHASSLPNQANQAHLSALFADQLLALLSGDHARLATQTQETLAFARQLGGAPSILTALLHHATAVYAHGDGARACRVLREALQLAMSSGDAQAVLGFADPSFHALLETYRQTRETLDDPALAWLAVAGKGVAPAPAEDKPAIAAARCGLTPKEAEVLRLMADGASNQDIAVELMISLATVKWHVRNVLSKLDAANRSGAIARARRLRLIA